MGKPLRVLLVGNSEDDAELLMHELKRGGYDPTYERAETREAMAQALERQASEVVLADYPIPAFSGLAALELLKERGLDLPFIIVSGSIGEEVAMELVKAGAHDFIMKDNLKGLNVAIERELKCAQMRRELKQAEEALAERTRELRRMATELEAVNQVNLRLIKERSSS
jgi:DNA-binding NtrC family response regulator